MLKLEKPVRKKRGFFGNPIAAITGEDEAKMRLFLASLRDSLKEIIAVERNSTKTVKQMVTLEDHQNQEMRQIEKDIRKLGSVDSQ